MKGNSFLGEWKSIFTNKALLIPIIGVLLIPVLYAGMFLWAFWDPYDKLEDLPVAIVNDDQGASFEGEQLQLGDELVKNLKKDKQFNFIFVDKEKGYKNLKDQDYYMLVEIPSDFSSNATTILDNTPKKLELKYVPNEGYNFLSAQIGETAIEKIKAAVSEKIIKTYSDTVFDKMQTMADGYQEASGKAGELLDGASQVNDGTKTMKESLAVLAAKQIEFKSGVDTIYEGVGKLSKGSDTLASGVGQLNSKFGDIQAGGNKIKTGIDSLASASKELNAGMNTVYSKTDDLVNGAKKLQDGSNQLQNGLQELNKKIPSLTSGVKSISANANELSTGATNVAQGAQSLHAGLQKLQSNLAALPPEVQQQLSESVSQLVQVSQKVAEGSKSVAAGSGELAKGGNQLASGATAAQQGVDQLLTGSRNLTAGLNELSNGSNALQAGLGQLNDGTGQLVAGVGELQNGQNTLVSGMAQYGSKMNEASKGAQDLNLGLQTLSGGVTQLADGSNQLSDGANKLSAGAVKLADGSTKLQDGTNEFKTVLGDAASESSKLHATEKTSDMMSKPLDVDKEAVDHVPNYGTGFAPYFLSLGLFVGALMLSILYPMIEPAVIPKNAFSWFASKFGVLAVVGIIQALIASAILLLGLKIEVQSVPLFLLYSIITSLVFITLIQFFVTCFGNPGRFMAIIILILQLTTSAGTFPLELIPEPLQFFNAILPMTYTVQGFKAVISSGDFSFMWSNAAVIGGFIVVFMLGTLSYFVIKFKKSYSKFSTEETA